MQSPANQKQSHKKCDVLRLLNEFIGHHRVYGDTIVFQLPAQTKDNNSGLGLGKSEQSQKRSRDPFYDSKKSERDLTPTCSVNLVSRLLQGQLKLANEVTVLTMPNGKTKKLTGKEHVVWKSSSLVHAAYLLRAMLEVVFSSIPDFHSNDPEDLLQPLFKLGKLPLQDFVSCAKYWTAFPMAKYLHNDLPPRPQSFPNPNPGAASDFLFRGKALQQLRNRLVARNNRNTELFLGILQGVKRAALEVPESFVLGAMFKHKAALNRPPLSGVGERMVDNLDYEKLTISEAIDMVTNVLGPRIKKTKFELFEASTSSGYKISRLEGGQREQLVRSHDNKSGTVSSSMQTANRFINRDELKDMIEVSPGKIAERKRDMYVPQTLRDLECLIQQELKNPCESDLKPASKFPELRYEVAAHGRKWVIPTKVASVLEPLKVRLVSSGEPLFYWASRFMQKSMWGSLRSFKQFRLTSNPLSENDFHVLIEDERKSGLTRKLGEKPFWVSGDFSGATDNVEIRFTKEVFEQLLMYLDVSKDMKEVLRAVLYEQYINYPNSYVTAFPVELSPFLQTNGQLMGSTLSFPILCVINFCCYIAAIEEWTGQKLSYRMLKILPVLVNGDDILFRANEALYGIWKVKIDKAGFYLSVGKNYIDSQYLMINSQMWKCVEDVNGINGVRFDAVKWVNVGLLMAQSKSSGRNVLKDLPAEELYRQAVCNTPNPKRLHNRFIFYNLPLVERLTSSGKFNLFISRDLGGLGFQKPAEVDPSISDFQSKLGNYLLHKKQQIFGGFPKDLKRVTEQIALIPTENFEIEEVYQEKVIFIVQKKKTDVLESCNIEGTLFVEREFIADRYKIFEQPLTQPVKPASEVEIKSITKKLLTEFKQKNLPKLSREKLFASQEMHWVEIHISTALKMSEEGVKIEYVVPDSIKNRVKKNKSELPSPDDLILLAEQSDPRFWAERADITELTPDGVLRNDERIIANQATIEDHKAIFLEGSSSETLYATDSPNEETDGRCNACGAWECPYGKLGQNRCGNSDMFELD